MSVTIDDHGISVVCSFCGREVRKSVDGRNPGVVDAPLGLPLVSVVTNSNKTAIGAVIAEDV